MNLPIILWIWGLLLIKVEGLDDVCVDGLTNKCECFNRQKTTQSIECCGDKIISLEWSGTKILYELTDSTCNSTSSCSNIGFTIHHQDKLNIYYSCSGQNRCNVTVNPYTDIKILLPVSCLNADTIFSKVDDYPINVTKEYLIFYITGNDDIGKQVSHYCTASSSSASLYLVVLYLNLGPESCKKINLPNFDLGCTDTGVTLFYTKIGVIGREMRLEITDLELEKDEVIYATLSDATGLNVSVHCHGNQRDTPVIGLNVSGNWHSNQNVTEETLIIPSTTERSKIDFKIGDEFELFLIFGGIIAGLIIINLVGIGIYCYLRNRKKPKKTGTTNMAMSQRSDNASSSYCYVDVISVNDHYEHLP